MSVIAKSLNRLKKEKSPKRRYYSNRLFRIENLITFLLILCFFIFTGFASKFFIKELFKKEQNFPDIRNYINKFNNTVNEYENSKEYNKIKLDYLIASGNIKNLEKAIQKIKNLPKSDMLYYNAVILFKKGKIDEAEHIFKACWNNSSHKDEIYAYLGEIKFKKGEYLAALNYYNKIKKKSYIVNLNIGIIYELMGNIRNAIKYYKLAITQIKDPFLKKRIYNKLFLLDIYEKEYN